MPAASPLVCPRAVPRTHSGAISQRSAECLQLPASPQDLQLLGIFAKSGISGACEQRRAGAGKPAGKQRQPQFDGSDTSTGGRG